MESAVTKNLKIIFYDVDNRESCVATSHFWALFSQRNNFLCGGAMSQAEVWTIREHSAYN